MTETFYDLLDVPEDASTGAIEEAYREAIKQVHPDVSDDVDAAERTKRLNRAKRVLTDESERARYDRLGHAAYTDGSAGSTGSGTESGSDDATGSAEDGAGRGGRTSARGRRRNRSRRGDWNGSTRNGSPADRWRDDGASSSGGRSSGGETSSAGETSSDRQDGATADSTRYSTGPSRGSAGPSWQSAGGTTASAAGGARGRSTRRGATAGGASGASERSRAGGPGGAGGTGTGPSARRQAAAGATDGPNVGWSWNAWEATRSWAVRQGRSGYRGLHPSRLFPAEQSTVLIASCFLLYPCFVLTVLFPPFPVVARLTVGVCTLLMFAYLLSVPEVAIVVYGVWSLLVPVFLVALPGVGPFSLAGVVGLIATWIPLGIAVFARSVIRV
jgi:curved DNA-binding protein CbpA